MESSPTLAKARATLLVCDSVVWREIFVSFTGLLAITILGYKAIHDIMMCIGLHTLVIVVQAL